MKKIIIVIISGMFFLISCQNVLDEVSKNLVTADSRFSTPEGILDGVNGIYPSLRTFYGREEGLSLTVYGTDTYTYGVDGKATRPEYNEYSGALTGSTNFLSAVWFNMYKGINAANTVIERVGVVEGLTDGEKSAYEAEARFLRALFYFHLVRQWGAVHFTLEETQGVETEAYRTDPETIYNDGIIPDLEFAIANLPDVQQNFGRPAKAAARGMLARVYSTIAGADKNSSLWAEVELLTEAIIADPEYGGSLTEDYIGLWNIDNQENEDIIWSIQYSDVPDLNEGGNRAHLYFLCAYEDNPAMTRDIENGRSWKRFMPTSYAIELFDRSMDSRFDGTFKTVWYANLSGQQINGQEVELGDTSMYIVTEPVDDAIQASKPYWYIDYNGKFTGASDVVSSKLSPSGEIGGDRKYYPGPFKHQDPTRIDKNTAEGQRDWPEMRLSEMYLLAAEAEFYQNKKNEAVNHINEVRRRAAWPGKEDAMEITEANLDFEFILDERARELMSEGHRWYTLQRTRTLETRLPLYNLDATGFNQDKHYLRPIPQDQIDAVSNPEDFIQNPGY